MADPQPNLTKLVVVASVASGPAPPSKRTQARIGPDQIFKWLTLAGALSLVAVVLIIFFAPTPRWALSRKSMPSFS